MKESIPLGSLENLGVQHVRKYANPNDASATQNGHHDGLLPLSVKTKKKELQVSFVMVMVGQDHLCK